VKYVIVFALDGAQYALEKTTDAERAQAVMQLWERHMPALFPNAMVEVSYDRGFNEIVENHPDKTLIMGLMLQRELPMKHRVIEHG